MDAVARVRASVHTKLLAGFLVGALLLLGMGILSMVVLNRMGGQVEELTALQERNDRARQMIYLVTAQSHFRAMALLTTDDVWNNKVADAKTAFVSRIDTGRADPRPGQQAEFAAITVINDRYAASGEEVLALYESGSLDGALGLHLTEEHDISHELEELLNKVIDESTAEMIAASADLRSDRDGLRFAVVAFSGISLLTAVLLGVVLSGTFVRPLRASNATLALIGEGDFTQRLAEIFREVGNTADRRVAAEGVVAAVMIVAVQPARKGGGASRLAAVDADVGPLLEEGAVEALDLAVGLGMVGPCAAAAHAGGEARARECGATVGGAVVGEHGAHGDAALSEPGTGPLPEGDRGDRALVGEDLAVGEAGVIVDHGADVGEADAAVTVMAVATAAVDAPAAAWGDAAQLLDVHVEQVSGPGVLVAAADHPPGRAGPAS